jgi:cytosine/creatinine deaminase
MKKITLPIIMEMRGDTMKYLFKNARLVHEDQVVDLCTKDKQVFISKDNESEKQYDQVIDLEGRMVIRGFSDTHMHLDKALIGEKVINHSGTLDEAIKIMSKYKPEMTDQDIEERMKRVIDWAYKHGTRFLRTNIDIDKGIKLRSFKIIQKLKEQYKDKMVIESIAFPQEGFLDEEENFELLEQALKEGADVLGGIPAFDHDPQKHLARLMELAVRYDVDLDAHIDETDDPNVLTIKDLIKLTKEYHYEGRVTAAHCCSLAANFSEVVDPILEDVKKLDINIVPLPSTNLYLQGRGDVKNIRRGIAPIKKMMHDFGINVAIGSDNVRDPFNCFGNANPLEAALIAAHGAHMGATQDFKGLFNAVSVNGMKIMKQDYHINQSKFFVVVDSKDPRDAVISQSRVFGFYESGLFVKD